MDEVEIDNSTNPENPENDQPQKAKYAIQVKLRAVSSPKKAHETIN